MYIAKKCLLTLIHSIIRHTQMLNQQIWCRCTEHRKIKSEMNALYGNTHKTMSSVRESTINMRLRSGSRHWVNSIEPLNLYDSVFFVFSITTTINHRTRHEWDCAMIMLMIARFTWATQRVNCDSIFNFDASYDYWHISIFL